VEPLRGSKIPGRYLSFLPAVDGGLVDADCFHKDNKNMKSMKLEVAGGFDQTVQEGDAEFDNCSLLIVHCSLQLRNPSGVQKMNGDPSR
jgi:hypothetical protein